MEVEGMESARLLRFMILGVFVLFIGFGITSGIIQSTQQESELQQFRIQNETIKDVKCQNNSKIPENITKEIEIISREVSELNTIIELKRLELHKLYEKSNKTVKDIRLIKMITKDIFSLMSEKSTREDKLTQLVLIKIYTTKNKNGTLIVNKKSLPEIKNLSSKVSKAQSSMEMVGEELMQKRMQLGYLYEKGAEGENVWIEAKNLEQEIHKLENEHRVLRDQWLTLRAIEKLSSGPSILAWCWPGWLFCPSPTQPINEGWNHLYGFQQVRVWVGIYDGSDPRTSNKIDEYCTGYFTTDMNYYWQRALNIQPNAKSIQVKWFYLAIASADNKRHDIIWEKNKNYNREWSYPCYADYTTEWPGPGWYKISNYENHHACCDPGSDECDWCNTHCDGCFACDRDKAQHFVFKANC